MFKCTELLTEGSVKVVDWQGWYQSISIATRSLCWPTFQRYIFDPRVHLVGVQLLGCLFGQITTRRGGGSLFSLPASVKCVFGLKIFSFSVSKCIFLPKNAFLSRIWERVLLLTEHAVFGIEDAFFNWKDAFFGKNAFFKPDVSEFCRNVDTY